MLGAWWLFDNTASLPASTTTAGELTDPSSDKWELTLAGSLLPSALPGVSDPPTRVSTHTIHGKTIDAKAVSLTNAFCISQRTTHHSGNLELSGVSEEIWAFDTYAVGSYHVEPDTVFSEITLSFDVLSEWAHSFKQTPDYDFDTRMVKVPDVWAHSTTINDNKVTLIRAWPFRETSKRFHLDQKTCFQIEGEIPFTEVRSKWVHPLRQLLQFLTLRIVRVSQITATLQTPPTQDDPRGGIDIDLHLSEPLAGRGLSSPPSWIDMLMRLDPIVEARMDVSSLLDKWFNTITREPLGLNYLLASGEPHLRAEIRHLLAFQALESYHRLRFRSRLRDRDEHRRIVEMVMGEISEQSTPKEATWIETVLQNSNSKSLRTKIGEVLTEGGSTTETIQRIWPEFASEIYEQRNRAAHATVSDDEASYGKCIAVAIGLQWVMRHVYLRELGFAECFITRHLENCQAYNVDLRKMQHILFAQ